MKVLKYFGTLFFVSVSLVFLGSAVGTDFSVGMLSLVTFGVFFRSIFDER